LAQLRIPGLIVVGDQDAYTTRQDAEGMRSLIPDAELLWLPGVGHMPNLEAAEPFNAGLTGLLRRVAAVGD
jgi:pimeloyl-ACP methyl ester carboxylesterase